MLLVTGYVRRFVVVAMPAAPSCRLGPLIRRTATGLRGRAAVADGATVAADRPAIGHREALAG